MEKFNKIDIAESQLETALQLYFSGDNFVSALTLAGAAEEILGVCLKLKGIPTSLEETVKGTCLIHEKFHGVRPPKKEIIERANRARNNFKHLNSEEDIEITMDLEEEAKDMLQRAITNYWRFKEDLTKNMVQFEKMQRST